MKRLLVLFIAVMVGQAQDSQAWTEIHTQSRSFRDQGDYVNSRKAIDQLLQAAAKLGPTSHYMGISLAESGSLDHAFGKVWHAENQLLRAVRSIRWSWYQKNDPGSARPSTVRG